MTPADAVTGPKNGVLPDVPAWVQDSALLDAIAAAVVATDTAGTIFYFNAAAEQLYDHPREAMLGANVMKLVVEPVDAVPAGLIRATVLPASVGAGSFESGVTAAAPSWSASRPRRSWNRASVGCDRSGPCGLPSRCATLWRPVP